MFERSLFLLFLLVVSSASYSSSADNVRITKVIVQAENGVGVDRVCIYHDGDMVGLPSCNISSRYCSDINTALGNAFLSTALTAYVSSRLVKISGTGFCNLVSNSEDINYILLRE